MLFLLNVKTIIQPLYYSLLDSLFIIIEYIAAFTIRNSVRLTLLSVLNNFYN